MRLKLDYTIELEHHEAVSLQVLLILLDSKEDQLTEEQKNLRIRLMNFLRGGGIAPLDSEMKDV